MGCAVLLSNSRGPEITISCSTSTKQHSVGIQGEPTYALQQNPDHVASSLSPAPSTQKAFPRHSSRYKMQSNIASRATALRSSTLRVAPVPFAAPAELQRDVTAFVRKKGIRLIVTLECTEARAEGASPSRYVTQKNRKNTPDRLELMKYNPNLKRHTLHKEIK